MLQYCFCFMFHFIWPQGILDLSPLLGIKLAPLQWKLKSNHCMPGKSLWQNFIVYIYFSFFLWGMSWLGFYLWNSYIPYYFHWILICLWPYSNGILKNTSEGTHHSPVKHIQCRTSLNSGKFWGCLNFTCGPSQKGNGLSVSNGRPTLKAFCDLRTMVQPI